MKVTTLLLTAGLVACAATPVALATPTQNQAAANQTQQDAQNMFGGPVYAGDPSLDVTAALVQAGGGADAFSFSDALVNMLGKDTVNAEIDKLTDQYGEDAVNTFVGGMNYAVNDALKRASKEGIDMPEPADLSGTDLAAALVKAGVSDDGTYWSGLMFDHAISHDLHNQVMTEINTNPDLGYAADKTTHKLLNQAMYDVAQALEMDDVELADLH